MKWFRQLSHQIKFDLLVFRRNPAATFFTVVLPLIFLVLMTAIFGNEELPGGRRVATFYVPGIMALAIISATMVNVAFNMTSRRERGILKRVRGTPLDPNIFVASQALAGMLISFVMAVIVIGVGWALFDVSVNSVGVPPMLVTILLGAAAFSALGLAITSIIPSEEAAPAVTNVIVLPLYFISDVFVISEGGLGWISDFANLFPVIHLSQGLGESFDPFATATPWPWQHWLVIAAWGIFGLVVTRLTFSWTPRR
jgi:ABC-2 type transport system permease protein